VTLAVLRARMAEAHARFGQAASTLALSGIDLETQPVDGTWSARDLAAHLADWNEEILLAARALLGEIARPEHHPIPDFQAFNETRAKPYGRLTWAEAKARLDATVARATELAGRFDGRLEEGPIEHPWNNHGTVRDLFHGVCGHEEEHAEALEAWAAQQRDAR
jgi:hypothetical protein